MSIATQITALQTDKTNISNAITTMGGTVTSSDGFDNFASDILTIPSGGGTDYMAERVQGTLSSYTIPTTCTKISSYAFAYMPITSISIPYTITQIGESAFEGSKLTSITIPTAVTRVEANAFGNCFDLTTVNFQQIGTGITYYYGSSAFNTCTKLKTLTGWDPKIVNYSVPLSMFASTALEGDISLGSHCAVDNRSFNNTNSTGILYIHLTQTDTTQLASSYTFGPASTTSNRSFNFDHCRLVVPYSADHSILSAYQTTFNKYSSIMIEETQ